MSDDEQPWDHELTGKAYEIAASKAAIIGVKAGPGTGKSRVIERRALRLLADEKVPGPHILAVTLTKTAAGDLRKKLHRLSGQGAQPIVAQTLHSYCHNLLSNERVFESIGRKPRMLHIPTEGGYRRFEIEPLFADLSDAKYGGVKVKNKMIFAFEAAWAREFGDEPFRNLSETEEAFKHDLLSWLEFHRGMLVGELAPRALEFMKGNPEDDSIRRFKHVFVDEYQDLNQCEQELIEEIRGGATLMIVGDADQSIYSFRHAKPEGLAQFAKRHPDAEDQTLDICYRCPEGVTKPGAKLISRNYEKYEIRLRHDEEKPKPWCVRVRQWQTQEDEINGVVAWVKWLIKDKQIDPAEILVLCSTKKEALAIRDKLRDASIDCQSHFAEKCFAEVEAREAFSLLTLAAVPQDRVSLRYLLGLGDNKWRAKEYAKLREYCVEHHLSPKNALEALKDNDPLGIPGLLERWATISADLAEFSKLKGQALIDKLFPPDAEWAEELLIMLEHHDILETADAKDLHKLLLDEISDPSTPEGVKHVRLMSFFGSKGLTAQAVALVGCVDTLVPRKWNPAKSTFETEAEHKREQRRLFYVVWTRTTEYLLVSGFIQMPQAQGNKLGAPGKFWGKNFSYKLSPFITSDLSGEIPKPNAKLDFNDE